MVDCLTCFKSLEKYILMPEINFNSKADKL
jgi:hypothetical protein